MYEEETMSRLSRSGAANQDQPELEIDHKNYGLYVPDGNFRKYLAMEQLQDLLIQNAMRNIANDQSINNGALNRMEQKLWIENDILLNSGCPVVPSSLWKSIAAEYNNTAHYGTDKIYPLLRQRFYWHNMFSSIQSFIANCQVCKKQM